MITTAMKDFTWNITEKNSKKNIELTKCAQKMTQSEFMRRIAEDIAPKGEYLYSINLSELFIEKPPHRRESAQGRPQGGVRRRIPGCPSEFWRRFHYPPV